VDCGFLYRYFSFRISSFQIALACSSVLLNDFSVPRDLRYAAFIMFDILQVGTGFVVLCESRLQLPSELPASLSVC